MVFAAGSHIVASMTTGAVVGYCALTVNPTPEILNPKPQAIDHVPQALNPKS